MPDYQSAAEALVWLGTRLQSVVDLAPVLSKIGSLEVYLEDLDKQVAEKSAEVTEAEDALALLNQKSLDLTKEIEDRQTASILEATATRKAAEAQARELVWNTKVEADADQQASERLQALQTEITDRENAHAALVADITSAQEKLQSLTLLIQDLKAKF
jgi:chromosome segregation ATPase